MRSDSVRVPDPPSGHFRQLAGRLQEVRREHLTRRLKLDLALALALATWAYSGLTLVEWAAAGSRWPNQGDLIGSLVVLVAGAALSLGRFLVGRPPLDWYARQADLQLGLPETVSTAFEIGRAAAHRGGGDSSRQKEPAGAAIGSRSTSEFVRMHTLSEGLRLYSPFPTATDRARYATSRYALGFAAAALLLAFLPAIVHIPEPAPAPSPDRVSTVIEQVAAVLEELAPRVEESEYVRAIARELTRLASELEGSEALPPDVMDRYRELMSHAGVALAADPDSLRAVMEAAAEANSLFSTRNESEASAPVGLRDSDGKLDLTEGMATGEDGPGEKEAQRADQLPAGASSDREGGDGSELKYAQQVLEYDPHMSEYAQEAPEVTQLREALERLEAQYAMPVGEARGEQAGAFANDEIAADGILTSDQGGEEFILPETPDSSRTIRVEAPVEENLVAMEAGDPVVGEWRRVKEELILPEEVPAEYREAVSRYFDKDSEAVR